MQTTTVDKGKESLCKQFYVNIIYMRFEITLLLLIKTVNNPGSAFITIPTST